MIASPLYFLLVHFTTLTERAAVASEGCGPSSGPPLACFSKVLCMNPYLGKENPEEWEIYCIPERQDCHCSFGFKCICPKKNTGGEGGESCDSTDRVSGKT
jgi:hypothetical protein